jgi:hypothetical protein
MKKVQIRKLPLVIGVALSGLAYEIGERRNFPDWPTPFDMNEHARHLAPGLGLGFTITYLLSKIEVSRNKALSAGIGATALVGSVFETGVFDGIYRNTTHSIPDAGWTIVAGILGACCVRDETPTELS